MTFLLRPYYIFECTLITFGKMKLDRAVNILFFFCDLISRGLILPTQQKLLTDAMWACPERLIRAIKVFACF